MNKPQAKPEMLLLPWLNQVINGFCYPFCKKLLQAAINFDKAKVIFELSGGAENNPDKPYDMNLNAQIIFQHLCSQLLIESPISTEGQARLNECRNIIEAAQSFLAIIEAN